MVTVRRWLQVFNASARTGSIIMSFPNKNNAHNQFLINETAAAALPVNRIIDSFVSRNVVRTAQIIYLIQSLIANSIINK